MMNIILLAAYVFKVWHLLTAITAMTLCIAVCMEKKLKVKYYVVIPWIAVNNLMWLVYFVIV